MATELTPQDFKIHPPIDDDKFFNIGLLPDNTGAPTIVLNFSKDNCRAMIVKLQTMLNELN